MKQPCTNYDTLSARLRLRVPDASVPQLHNLALFISGLVLAGHVHVPKIALFLPIAGNAPNALQRLERFLKNKASAPTLWYKGVARAGLFAKCRQCQASMVENLTVAELLKSRVR